MNCILVTGSREWDYIDTINEALSSYDTENTLMVVGDAKGADRIATELWLSRGGECKIFKPDWSKGRVAGILRNKEMINYVIESDFISNVTVLGFNLGTPGTTHTITHSRKLGLHVMEYTK